MARLSAHVLTRGSLGNALGKIATTKAVVGGLGVFNQILLIRLFQESGFGLYVLLLSVVAFFNLGNVVFESGIARFWPGAGLTGRIRLASAVLFFKLVLLALMPLLWIFGDSFAEVLNVGSNFRPDFLMLIAISPFYLCSVSMLSFISAALGALLLYRDLAIVGIVQALGTTLILLSGHFTGALSLPEFFFLLTLVICAAVVAGALLLARRHPLLAFAIARRPWAQDFPGVFRRYLRSYSLPLIATSLFGYVKNNTANLVVGSQISMETLGAFAAFRQVSAIPHKAFDSLIERLFPHLFKLADSARCEYRHQTQQLEGGTRRVRLAICLLLLAAFPVICVVYNLPLTPEYFLLHTVFLLNLYFSYRFTLAKISFYRLKTTTPIAAGAAVRAVITAAATVLLTGAIGVYGAALSILLGTILSAQMLTEMARRLNEEDAAR